MSTKAKIEMVNKITSKSVIGNVKNAPFGLLYTLFGIVHRATVKETNFGDSIEFGGSFKAKLPDGSAVAANKAFLPTVLESAIDAALAQADGSPVEFAVNVFKREDESSAVGYVYSVEPLIDTSINSPLDALEKRALPALPAPEKTSSKKIKG